MAAAGLMSGSSRRRVVEADADLADDLANVEFETSDSVTVLKSFDSMALKEDLVRGIYAYGNYNLQPRLETNISIFLHAIPNSECKN
jgi:hypothetical protein